MTMCSSGYMIFSAIHLFVTCIFLCSTVYVLYRFINTKNDEKKQAKDGVRCAIIVIIATILTLFFYIGTLHLRCYIPFYTYHIFDILYLLSYAIQFYSLIILFFIRLNTIFIGTTYELSKYTK
eukprot:211214_1